MEATLPHQPLNAIQLHLLRLFSVSKNEDSLKELQTVLFDYYKNKLKVQTNDFWEQNNLNSDKMEAIMYGHNRIATK